jgi:hypothetical protein
MSVEEFRAKLRLMPRGAELLALEPGLRILFVGSGRR